LFITDVDIKVYLHLWIGQTITDPGAKYHIPAFFFWTISFLLEKNVQVIARNSWTVFGLCVMDCELYLKDDTWCKGMVDVDVLVITKMSVMDVAVVQHQFRIELWLTCGQLCYNVGQFIKELCWLLFTRVKCVKL